MQVATIFESSLSDLKWNSNRVCIKICILGLNGILGVPIYTTYVCTDVYDIVLGKSANKCKLTVSCDNVCATL